MIEDILKGDVVREGILNTLDQSNTGRITREQFVQEAILWYTSISFDMESTLRLHEAFIQQIELLVAEGEVTVVTSHTKNYVEYERG